MEVNLSPRQSGNRLTQCKQMLANLKQGRKTILVTKGEREIENFQMDMLKLTDALIVYDLISATESQHYYEIILV